MLLNEHTAISTSSVLLVPYSSWHVPHYHEWMQDEEIQEATASEPLSLESEYAMQRSWRQDPDKLTFITCLPTSSSSSSSSSSSAGKISAKEDDREDKMLGDINLFLRVDEGDEDEDEANVQEPQIVGEIELMIAERVNHRKGYGRAALLSFLRYIIEHEAEIMREFVPSTFSILGEKSKQLLENGGEGGKKWRFDCLSVKIGEKNVPSLALFESVGFKRVSEPNFFREMELRRTDLGIEGAIEGLKRAGIEGYVELDYVQQS